MTVSSSVMLLRTLQLLGLGKAGHNFEYCMIEPLKFSVGNPYDSDDTFIRAVIKVQQKREDELDTEEARVIEPWKLHYEQPSSQDMCDVLEPLSTFELMNREQEQKKKSKKSNGVVKSKYNPALMHCVLGSAAGAEHFWSMAGKVLNNQRSLLSPLVFKLIMYLKYNNCL
jgi:hypothetical protein